MFVSILLVGVAAAWLSIHQVVRRKLHNLHKFLPAAYQSAIAAPPAEEDAPRLIPLAIDLIRKEHCTLPYDALTPAEQRIALHAYAVEQLPRWVVNIAKRRLRGTERTVVNQLQFIKTSRPDHKPIHFGAIRAQQRLRSASES